MDEENPNSHPVDDQNKEQKTKHQEHSTLLVAGYGYVGHQIAAQYPGSSIGLARSEKSDALCPVHACDLSSPEQVHAVAAAIDTPLCGIIHCAASGRGGGADAYRAVYLEGARNLIAAFPDTPILFTSSTGVYPQANGEIVTEISPANPERETARILRDTEQLVLKNNGIVLRLAGIYGPDRSIHLQRILNGSATLETDQPSRWLNQIHRDDAASAALHLIAHDEARGEIFNGSDNASLRQRECYQQLADVLDLPCPPEGEPATGSAERGLTSKLVSSEKLLASGWQPRYSNFLDGVKNDPELLASIRIKLE